MVSTRVLTAVVAAALFGALLVTAGLAAQRVPLVEEATNYD
jgi:hypothetical protein